MFVTEDRIQTIPSIPFSLPSTLMPPAAWLGIAAVRVEEGQKLTISALSLLVAKIEAADTGDACAASGRPTINPDYPTASVASLFLIKDWDPAASPLSSSADVQVVCPSDWQTATTAEIPAVTGWSGPVEVTGAGLWHLVVLNNTATTNVTVCVTGSARLDLQPVQT